MLFFFIIAKFRIKWLCNNYLLSKISTIRVTTFILVVFQVSSRICTNLVNLKNSRSSGSFKWSGNWLFIVFLNILNVGRYILNISCIENPYKQMDMWACSFLKFKTYSIIFFPQWAIKYNFFEKYFNFILKFPSLWLGLLLQGYYLTDYTVLDNLNFLVSRHWGQVCLIC